MSRRQPLVLTALIFIAVSILGGFFWANLWSNRQRPGGADFAVYWASARTLLEFNATPYGELASLNAQQALGRTAQDPPVSASRLDLPLYSEMTVFPFAALSDFAVARAAWMLLMEAALLATGLLCLRLLNGGARLLMYVLPFFGIFWVQAVWPLTDGNVVILAGLLLVAGLVALRGGRDEAAGVFFALATFKFLTLGPFLIFVNLWCLARRRWRMPFAYLMSLGILIILSNFFYPNWFPSYLGAIIVNLRGPEMLSTGEIIAGYFPAIGARFGYLLTGLAATVLLWEWWAARQGDYRHLLWVGCLTLVLTPLLGLPTNPENYAVLILPVALLTLLIEERWGAGGRWVVLGLLAVLFAGLWVIYLAASNPSLALFFPAPIFLILGLYWVRWWAVHPPRTWIDTIAGAP